MDDTIANLEKLIAEAETRKRFLEQGLEALLETLNDANAELKNLKASAQPTTADAGSDPTTQTNRKGLTNHDNF